MKKTMNTIVTIAGFALICFEIIAAYAVFTVIYKIDSFLQPVTEWLSCNPFIAIIAAVILIIVNILISRYHKEVRRGKKSDWSF